jgi:hypothetical protein
MQTVCAKFSLDPHIPQIKRFFMGIRRGIPQLNGLSTSFAAAVLLVSSPAHAALDFVISESQTGVLVEGSGSVNLTGLTFVQTPSEIPLNGGFVNEYHDVLAAGTGAIDFFDGGSFAGSGAFGSGPSMEWGGLSADSGIGDPIGFDLFNAFVVVPESYVSGGLLSGSGFYADETIESMALSIGNFSWTNQAGVTVNLTVVPEPASYSVWFGVLVAFASCRRRSAAKRLVVSR